jgi:hypothetical protein
MLAQMGQMMQLRQNQQEYESQNALSNSYRQAYAGGKFDPQAVIRSLVESGQGHLVPKVEAQMLKAEQDRASTRKTQVETLGKDYENLRVGLTNITDENGYYNWVQSGFSNPATAAHLTQMGITPEKALANARAMVAKEGLSTAIAKSAMGIGEFIKQDLQLKNATQNANIAAAPANRRLDYDIKNPVQHYFTGEDNTLMGVSTRGGGAAAAVPMAGSNAPPPRVTIGGEATPMGTGSSIMNPSSVNAFNPYTQNGLITQPQTQLPTGSNYAKVRQPPTAITNINAYAPASETAQAEFMKGSRATFDQLKQSATVLDNIEKAKALVPTAKGFMGTGGETLLEAAKFMNNRLGTSIDTAGIKSAEELNTRAFMGILDNLKKLDAQPSQSQQAALKQALGSLSTDPSAMNAVLDVFGDIVRNKVDIYNQEVTGAEAKGIKFPYNPVIKLPERTPASTGDISTDAGVAKVIKSNAEFNALPSGTIFTAPDGTTRRKP